MIWLSFEEVAERYPAALSDLIHRLRVSHSQHRNADPKALSYFLEYGPGHTRRSYEGTSAYAQYAPNSMPEALQEKHGLSVAESREVARMLAAQTRLVAKKGRWSAVSDLVPCPLMVIELYHTSLKIWSSIPSCYELDRKEIVQRHREYRAILGDALYENTLRPQLGYAKRFLRGSLSAIGL